MGNAILLALVTFVSLAVTAFSVRAETSERLALAIYAPWFDNNTWQANITSDLPDPLSNSDDAATIQRDIALAQQAYLDGFVSFWIAPGNRTDRNFTQLLRASEGKPFRAAVGFLTNVAGAPNAQALVEALTYVRRTHTGHPNYLRHRGKPVIFFTDMGRAPGVEGTASPETWQSIRDQVDPGREMIWIAEGLDPSYLRVFDGLYVFKITHRDFPDDYVKASRWARQARAYGADKLWIGTMMPGWDDTRARDVPGGFRTPSPPHRRDREDGGFLRKTFQAALESQPDWMLVVSWNEWVEGTFIHPSQNFQRTYLDLTGELLARFKGSASAPAAAPAPAAPPARAAASALGEGCTFVLGFKVIHDIIPDRVGKCLVNEHHNPANGDALQETTGGLMVWRKADNFTAFTDGYQSWVNGPYGLQRRLNTERFPWEHDGS